MAREKGRRKKLAALLVCVLLVGFTLTGPGWAAGDAAQPDQIVLSWTADPQTSQTVAWRMSGTAGKVQYMKESEKTADFSGAQEKEAIGVALYDGYNHFEAELDNLQPGTAYAYRVGADGCWSEASTFSTAAATDNFSFMYMGDVQMGYEAWGQLLQSACAAYPELKFAMQCGDLVDETKDSGQWSDFFSAAAGVFDRIPLMPALGNHENEDPTLYFKSFALPQNGPAGLREHFYSYDYGNAHFVVLDSNRMGNDDAAQAGIDWLESDLQSSAKEWKFVMFHHPPYGVNSGNSGDDEKAAMMQEKWVPVMERNGVDMVFVGHQHMYMRTYPLREGQVKNMPSEGITYLMGNAGTKNYINSEAHDYIAKVFEGDDGCNEYTVISIDGGVLTMTTRNAAGSVLDEYKINKSGAMDSRVTVSSVKLLNSESEAIPSVSAGGYCRLQARLNNNTGGRQTATAVLQVRAGEGAAVDCGGEPLGIVSLQADVPASGADVYADFKIPDLPAGRAYVDVYVFDEGGMPIDLPYQQFSFTITSD